MSRNPWVAALLTVALPGLGHVYIGELRRGLALLAAFVLLCVGCVLILLYLPLAPLNVLLPLLLVLTAWLYIITDAFRHARTIEAFSPRSYNRWWIYVGAILVVGFVVLPAAQDSFRTRVASAYQVLSGAMAPTLLPGDYVLVDKRSYRKGSPERFEIAVYGREGGTYLHRIVGVPGDTLEMIQKVLHVNGDPAAEPYVRHGDRPTRDTWGPLVVPPGEYFVLGDNRDDSADSRYHGFVPREDLLGRALRVYFSVSGDGGVRWDRIGRGVS